MSGSASIDLERRLLQHTLAITPMAVLSRVYVALCVTLPTETAPGVEVSGGGYGRVAATFTLAAGATAANAATVEFPAAAGAWGVIGWFEIWDQAIGGARLYWGPLVDSADKATTLSLDITAGDIVRFSAGTLLVKVTDIEQHNGGQTLDGALGFWGDNTTVNAYDAKLWATGGATVADNPGHGTLNHMAGRHVFQGFDSTTQFRVGNIPWSYEFWEAVGGSSGTAAQLRTVSDLNADCSGVISMQGHGELAIGNGEGTMFHLPGVGGPITNYFRFVCGKTNENLAITAAGGDGLPCSIALNAHYYGGASIGNNNGTLAVFSDPEATSGVPRTSYLTFTAGSSGKPPSIAMAGAANETLRLVASGTGQISFANGRGTGVAFVDPGAAVTSYVSVKAGAGGASAIIAANAGNLFLGNSGQATTATTGHIQIPTCNGPPTGVPANAGIGATLIFDATNTRLYAYTGGAWRSVAFT